MLEMNCIQVAVKLTGKSCWLNYAIHFTFLRLGIRACVVLIPLLGITWLFGLLSSTHKAFVYIFTILNSAQVNFSTVE